MSKRKNKAQREAEQYSALWRRIYDVVSGACGRAFDEEEGCDPVEGLDLEDAERAIGALEDLFRGEVISEEGERPIRHEFDWLFSTRNLAHFGHVGKIADHLWENGVRHG